MYCKNCGVQLQEDDIICKSCGNKVETSLLEDTIEVLEQPTVTPKVDSQIQSIPMASSYIPPQTSMIKRLNKSNVISETQMKNPSKKIKSKSIFIIISVLIGIATLLIIFVLKIGIKPNKNIASDAIEENNVIETKKENQDTNENVDPEAESGDLTQPLD